MTIRVRCLSRRKSRLYHRRQRQDPVGHKVQRVVWRQRRVWDFGMWRHKRHLADKGKKGIQDQPKSDTKSGFPAPAAPNTHNKGRAVYISEPGLYQLCSCALSGHILVENRSGRSLNRVRVCFFMVLINLKKFSPLVARDHIHFL